MVAGDAFEHFRIRGNLRAVSGTGIYTKKIHLEKGQGRFWLDLGEIGCVAELHVNDKPVTTKLWPPYDVEITKQVVDGVNEIRIEVTSTFGNLLKDFYLSRLEEPVPSGLLGPCRIYIAEGSSSVS